MGAPAVLEPEVRRLRDAKAAAEREAGDLHEAATTLVAEVKKAGDDPLEPETFRRITEAFRAADVKREEARQAGVTLDGIYAMAGDPTPRVVDGPAAPARGGLSRLMASRFMAHPAYQAARQAGIFTGDSAMGNLGHIEVASREETEVFLAATGELPHGNLVPEDQRLGMPVPIPQRRIRVFSLVSQMTTDSDVVEWAREVAPTGNDITGVVAVRNAAAETPFGTAAPRSTYQFERATTSVQRIPTETVATKGNLADSSQLAGILRNRISDAVLLRAESQVISGNGTGNNLRGILSTTGIGALSRNVAGAERRVEAIHRAITNVRVNLEAEPNGIGIHPTTWEAIAFEKDSNGQYLLAADIRQSQAPQLWGLPVVVSTVFPTGTALIGQWGTAEWYLREGLTVNAYDQHQDFASKGLVLLLAQLRAAFVVPQPRAFCTVDQLA